LKKILVLILLGTLPLYGGEDYKLYKSGKRAWYSENWQEATTCFENVLENYPDSSFYKNSLYYLGSCQFKQGSFQNAFDYLSEYLEASGSTTSFQDAEELRILSAFKLVKTHPHMINVLREKLKAKHVEQVILSASLLLKLDDQGVIEALFKHLEQTESQRVQQKIILFIEENGSLEDQKKLRPFLNEGTQEVVFRKNKMIHLIVQEDNQEVLNITVPLSFVDYFQEFLSHEQITFIEKNEKKDFEKLIRLAKDLSEGEVLLKISSPEGDLIKIVVE